MARKSPPKLGRGLAALLGETNADGANLGGVASAESRSVHYLGVDQLLPGRFQPRQDIDEDKLGELAASIREQGILQPILVREDVHTPQHYEIIAGERRWRAAQLAGLHEVPVFLRRMDDAAAMAAALVENLQRSDLNAIEEAEGLRRLATDFALTQEELAQAVGKSRPHVANTMRLLNLPESVRGAIRQGGLSAGHARALLAHPSPVEAANLVMAKQLNVRQTEQLVQAALKGGNEKAAANVIHPEIKQLEHTLAEALGLKVSIRFDGRGGAVKIAYRNLEQFDALTRLLLPKTS